MEDERFVPPYGFSPGPSYAPRPAYPSPYPSHNGSRGQPPHSHSPYQHQHPHPHQSPYPPHLQPPPQLQAQSPFIPYHWSSPPMSPAMSTVPMQYPRARHGSFLDHQNPNHQNHGQDPRMDGMADGGAMSRGGSWMQAQAQQQGYMGSPAQNYNGGAVPPSAWNTASASPMSSYHFYSPQHGYQPHFDGQMPSPVVPMTPKFRGNRMSWSGPSRQLDGEMDKERKPYHPLPPAKRSDWVMWVGNVPQNTSHEELWRYFNSTIPPGDDPWKGPSSIFLISRSSCAFVNLSSQADLDRAVGFFNGRSLRNWDPRCPRMVCRVRRKDDDLRSGVGAQRGTGMHREWIKNSTGPLSPAAMEPAPEGEGRRRESIVDATASATANGGVDGDGEGGGGGGEEGLAGEIAKHRSTNSYASTNSSFLVRHFPKRVFILKSMTVGELEESVQTGTWRTQKHNEPILDQAYRTAPEVFLIFGANKTGEFFGYAKMVEPIDKEKAAAREAKLANTGTGRMDGAGSGFSPGRSSMTSISERQASQAGSERPNVLSPTSSSSTVPMASPSQLTPATEEEPTYETKSFIDLPPHGHGGRKSDGHESIMSAPADLRPVTLDPMLLRQSGMAAPIAAIRAAAGQGPHHAQQPVKGGSDRPQKMDDQGVLRKDTLATPAPVEDEHEHGQGGEEEEEPEEIRVDGEGETRGQSFKIEWVRVGPVQFGRTRYLRNPWNADREVKVSRDGTEVEPSESISQIKINTSGEGEGDRERGREGKVDAEMLADAVDIGSLLMAEWDRTA